jgi:hypothetical protein
MQREQLRFVLGKLNYDAAREGQIKKQKEKQKGKEGRGSGGIAWRRIGLLSVVWSRIDVCL